MSVNVAASLHGRLLNVAKRTGEEFERALVRYACERWLYRLGQSPHRDRFVLKGASLLSVWLPDPYRVTRDIDLMGFGRIDTDLLRTSLSEIAEVACEEDGVLFDLSDLRIAPIRAESENAGARALFLARLGKARIRMQLDIGFGDFVSSGPENVVLPLMLPTLPSTSLLAYPREQTIAEKFEAMVQLGARNGRMKDFHDVWALSGAFAFARDRLRRAVSGCFERRGVPRMEQRPPVLTDAFYDVREMQQRWSGYRSAGGLLQPTPEHFDEIGERIIGFLLPLWEDVNGGSAQQRDWSPERGWQ